MSIEDFGSGESSPKCGVSGCSNTAVVIIKGYRLCKKHKQKLEKELNK